MGGNMFKVGAVIAGVLGGYLLKRYHVKQDPAIFTAAAVLGTGLVPSSGALALVGSLTSGYVVGTMAKYFMAGTAVETSTTCSATADGRICFIGG